MHARTIFGILIFGVATLSQVPGSDRAAAQTRQSLLNLLPADVQSNIRAARDSCGTADSYADAGLQMIDLNGDGSRDIIVDWAYVGCGAAGTTGCSNAGCDLEIFKQTGPTSRKRIFAEHVSGHFVSVGKRFRLLAVHLVGGDARCKGEPIYEGSPKTFCDALVFWRRGTWAWQPIK